MNLDCFTFDENWLERLDAETVQRRRTIEEHWMLANHFLEDVPNDRLLPLDHLTCLLDRGSVLLFLKLVVDEWLKELKRHLLRQAALMKFEFRSNNYY